MSQRSIARVGYSVANNDHGSYFGRIIDNSWLSGGRFSKVRIDSGIGWPFWNGLIFIIIALDVEITEPDRDFIRWDHVPVYVKHELAVNIFIDIEITN